MDERKAEALAAILGGEAWNSGGGRWLITINRADGKLVVLSEEAVCEYDSEEAFDEGRAAKVIPIESDGGRWVIQDDEGNVFYQHDELELGWTNEYEAQSQARYLETREGGKYWVREQ